MDTTPQKNYKNNTGVDYPSHIGKTRVYWLQPGYEILLTGIEVHTYQVIYTYLIPVPIPSVYLPYTKQKLALDGYQETRYPVWVKYVNCGYES
jgi:hypothetical protein